MAARTPRPPSTPLDPLLTIGELAALLQVSEDTIYHWRAQGGGPPAIKVGKHLRWLRDDVAVWLRNNSEAA